MDLSRGFITKLVDEGKLNEALRSGIHTTFLSEDLAPVYGYVQRHFTDYKQVPSRGAVLKAFPDFEFGTYKEPLEYFIDGIKEQHRRSVLDEKLIEISDVYTKDTKKAEALLRDTLASLQVTQKNFKDVNIAEHALEIYEEYLKRKEHPGADGILSGWPSMDYQTLGFQKEEFAVLVGEKYMGKSWKMIRMAHKSMKQNERVLFITKEMSQAAVTRRLAAIEAGVCFDRLRRGELRLDEETRFKTALEKLHTSNYHFTIARQGVNTIDDIEAKAVETDASIIFGDSIYLFPPDHTKQYTGETNKRLAISQKCKEIAQRLGIPFIVSVQAGRKKSKEATPTLDDIEWSNAFSQDADTVFYLTKDELDRELKRAHMYLLKSRDGDLDDFFINTDFETMNFDEREDRAEPTTDISFDDEDDQTVDYG